ncbi:TadE/TadG family type IV pilus assembly protein [Actibacterium sp. 188UL27-1]|uniref:TadE/TadG family type IV pilus assembly protein n=1 Tax=Actibacterium sp. 188UL27-1 TaxID=2786961 RepID=UPI00195E2FB4|nr:hypothetical protein [Actibacterium sp. 188UL27-1]MBM7069192.1 hypothetical protein [Actibacterium sp. 188UL27-1]
MIRCLKYLSGFCKSTQGSISVESVLMFPMLALAMMSTYIYFDAFKAKNTNLKAVYTIADAIGREGAINDTYLDTMHRLLNFLTNSNHPTRLRVTLVQCAEAATCKDSEPGSMVYDVVWSQVRGNNINAWTDANINDLRSRLPVFPKGDSLLVVEIAMAYEPIFNVGFPALSIDNLAVTRARFIPPYICWEQGPGEFECPFGMPPPADAPSDDDPDRDTPG